MKVAVVDFSYLRASTRETIEDDLREYSILLTFELAYEISTNSDGLNSSMFYRKLQGRDLVHSQSLINLVKEEVKGSQRVDDVRHRNSKQLVGALINATGTSAQQEVQEFFETNEPKQFKYALDRMWNNNRDGIFAGLNSVDVQTDAKNYLKLFESPGTANVRGETIAKYHRMNVAPEPGWLIYDWERLRNFLAYRYRLNGTRSNDLDDKKLANELADLTYLAFISRVDAIATHDKKLICPLAQAFGPPSIKVIQPSSRLV